MQLEGVCHNLPWATLSRRWPCLNADEDCRRRGRPSQASVGIRHRGAPIRARLLAGLESGGQRLQRGGQQLDCLRQFERTTYIRNKPTTTTTTTTSYTTTTTTTQRLVPGLRDGPCPPSRRARPIAEQNTNKTKQPPLLKKLITRKGQVLRGRLRSAPRTLRVPLPWNDASRRKILVMIIPTMIKLSMENIFQ